MTNEPTTYNELIEFIKQTLTKLFKSNEYDSVESIATDINQEVGKISEETAMKIVATKPEEFKSRSISYTSNLGDYARKAVKFWSKDYVRDNVEVQPRFKDK